MQTTRKVTTREMREKRRIEKKKAKEKEIMQNILITLVLACYVIILIYCNLLHQRELTVIVSVAALLVAKLYDLQEDK